MACKAYLTVVDTVLMPFDPATLPSPTAPLGEALGAGQCVVQANAMLNATTLVDGASNRQHSGGCMLSSGSTVRLR